MRLDNLLGCKSSLRLKIVNILSQVVLHESFIGEQTAEVVRRCRIVFFEIEEFVCESVEGLWLTFEILDVEDGLWVRQVVLFQICIETRFWAAEVRNSCADTDASACHDRDPLEAAFFEPVEEEVFRECGPWKLVSILVFAGRLVGCIHHLFDLFKHVFAFHLNQIFN